MQRTDLAHASCKRAGTISMFSATVRAAWILFFLITLASEIVPLPLLGGAPLFCFKGFKAVVFMLLGFATPLTFWRFTSLNLGIAVITTASFIVELAQFFIPGHQFSIIELASKVMLLIAGWSLALVVRYEGKIKCGRFQIALQDALAIAQ